MKKFFSIIGLLLVGFCSVFCLTGCFAGESAYDIAVRNGFEGTESQWLEYIKGKDGQDGKDGVSYEDIRKLYDDLCNNGEYSGSFLAFLKDYIKVYDMGSFELVASHNLLSSVSVSCYFNHNQSSYVSSGSGVIYEIDETNNEVYVVTNYHVVYVSEKNKVCDDININLYGREYLSQEISCDYVGGSEAYDVAVLKVSGVDAKTIIDGDYVAAEIAGYDEMIVGEDIIAIGNPQGEGITVVSGIISADSKYSSYKISSTLYKHRVFQVDAPINSGNSGGGVYNSDGKLTGLVCSDHASLDLDENQIVEGMGYAIPVMHVDAIYKYCKNNYRGSPVAASKYLFGITNQAANSTAIKNNKTNETEIIEDVAIAEVNTEGLGKKIGLKVDDLFLSMKIVKTDGSVIEMNITRLYLVGDMILHMAKGDAIEIKVKRGGVQTTLNYVFTESDDQFIKTCDSLSN